MKSVAKKPRAEKQKTEKTKNTKSKAAKTDEDDSTFSKVIIFAGIVCILLLLVLVRVFNENRAADNLNQNKTIDIISYMEFSCVHAENHWNTLLDLKKIYGDSVQVKVKHFPQSIESLDVENAIRCARDQDKHLEYISRLFDNKADLDVESLKKYAWAEGLNVSVFYRCVDNREHLSRIKEDLADGLSLGVNATPTTFVGDEVVVGAKSVDAFRKVVDSQLGLN